MGCAMRTPFTKHALRGIKPFYAHHTANEVIFMRRALCLLLTGPAVFLLCISLYFLAVPLITPQAEARLEDPPSYTLSEYQGQLALFRDGETEPIARYEAYTNLLPPGDAALIQAGIPVSTQEELQRLLEDFGV